MGTCWSMPDENDDFAKHHRAFRTQEAANYKCQQEKWQFEQALLKQTQGLYAQQPQRAATASQEQSLQQNTCMPQASAPPLYTLLSEGNPRKSLSPPPLSTVLSERKPQKSQSGRPLSTLSTVKKPQKSQLASPLSTVLSEKKLQKSQNQSVPPLSTRLSEAKPEKSINSKFGKVPTKTKAGHSNGSKVNTARPAASNDASVERTAVDYIENKHFLSRKVAETVVQLLKENNTLEFIATYRKNLTLGLELNELRNIKTSYETVQLIEHRANSILQEIQGKSTTEIQTFVRSMKNLHELEELHFIWNSKEAKLAERFQLYSRGINLQAIVNGGTVVSLTTLVKPEIEDFKTTKAVRNSILCIIADTIIKDVNTLREIQALRIKHEAVIKTAKLTKTDEPDKLKQQDMKYRYFYNFSSSTGRLQPHQILDIDSGTTKKKLTMEIDVPSQSETDFKEYCKKQYAEGYGASPWHESLLTDAFDYAWYRLVKPSICRQTWEELKEKAIIHGISDIVRNTRQHFLASPLAGEAIIGIYPGFQLGCALAVVSERGNVLQTQTIHPHDTNDPEAKFQAQRILASLVIAHNCTILVLSNGTAARETEIFLVDQITNCAFAPLTVKYTIVEDAEVSIYAVSSEASAEFPRLDKNVRSAIFIARFLQNPMAELVKLDPQSLRLGMYKKRLPRKQWVDKVNEVITETVSFVGVDVNTAPFSLLRRIAGLDETKAYNIIEWRKKYGPFRTRNDLKKVQGFCSKTFEQCAGFLRIIPETVISTKNGITVESLDYFDQTSIHPEFYGIARAFLTAANCNPSQIGTKAFIFSVQLYAIQGYGPLAEKFSTSIETMKLIVEAFLTAKNRDIRGEQDPSVFHRTFKTIDQLEIGTSLTGVVRNLEHYGAFIDAGLKVDGLIHVTEMRNVLFSIGQRVEVKVKNIVKERGRIDLKFIKFI